MALKVYLDPIGMVNDGTTLYAYSIASVFENGTLVATPINTYSVMASTATVASVRTALQTNWVTQFNAIFSRTDGNTAGFLWLDGGGLLGL